MKTRQDHYRVAQHYLDRAEHSAKSNSEDAPEARLRVQELLLQFAQAHATLAACSAEVTNEAPPSDRDRLRHARGL